MDIPLRETIFEQIQRKEYGPIQAAEELAQIREEVKEKTLKSLKDKLKTLKGQSLLLNSSWSTLLKNIVFSTLSASEQLALLKLIQPKISKHYILLIAPYLPMMYCKK